MTHEDRDGSIVFAAVCLINLAWVLAIVLIGELLDLWSSNDPLTMPSHEHPVA